MRKASWWCLLGLKMAALESFATSRGKGAEKEVPYIDPRNNMIFVVDQELQECVSMRPKPPSTDIQAEMLGIDLEAAKPFQAALQRKLDCYLASHFPTSDGRDGRATGIVYTSHGKDIGGDIELRVIISSYRARPRGYWAGIWSSQWRIVFVPEQPEPAKLAGLIEFKTHYTEDGNVHFHRKAIKSAKVAETTDCEKFATELMAAIGRLEEEFHANTEEVCDSYGTGALKAMRRVLPLSKERFDWRPIRHALVRDMKAVGKEGGC
eukprot:CAMPEP_0179179658 /NCGR_PEP_ID=MMETSP0796-20121207/88919_1 /TAXON_ID=73915 /ORGANISM="Pyrodinium bahamense, Strain pbaha01" /LENGTH=264 /DNA_ID=CAMNT_0020883327 /DNA_START=129 /DNA_END=923 /DNA_ORIENTATION=+